MIVHLMDNEKFVLGEINVFECFYPNRSLYVLSKGKTHIEDSLSEINHIYLDKKDNSHWSEIERICNNVIDYVLVYYATQEHMSIALHLKKKFGCKVYWMFFGADLYSPLYTHYKYSLFDSPVINFMYKVKNIFVHDNWQLFEEYAESLDSFCFWNPYDFKLLQKYIPSCHAKYRYYLHGMGYEIIKGYIFPEKKQNFVQINNSAYPVGNHLTILRKLKELDKKRQLQLILPLSYGKKVYASIVEYYSKYSGLKCRILKGFMPAKDYFELVNGNAVALFGNNRQQAGGNIFTLLQSGTKVFLRNNNNMIKLLRDWGAHIYSFEDDLKSMEDLLTPLTIQQKKDNLDAINKHCNKDLMKESMSHFFD